MKSRKYNRKYQKTDDLNVPLYHQDHKKPRTRREFLSQGFISGMGTALFPCIGGVLLPMSTLKAATLADCGSPAQEVTQNNNRISNPLPLICIDCAGGAALASNFMVGGPQGQMDDTVGTQGYGRMGLLPEMISDVNTEFGVALQADSGICRGLLEKTSATSRANINGFVMPCASNDDSNNNVLNPAHAICAAGAVGSITALVGTRNSRSGGKSISLNESPTFQPTVITNSSDTTSLINGGGNGQNFIADAVSRISQMKLDRLQEEKALEDIIHCASLLSADTSSKLEDVSVLNPLTDPVITSVLTPAELSNGVFDRTAAIMKLVLDGFAAAGTIEVGGSDYHNGTRSRGEAKDLQIGRVIGACLEAAAMKETPVMVFVFSDGACFSNGRLDGTGKPVWTGDDGSKGLAAAMVYSPIAPQMRNAAAQQMGFFSPAGAVSVDGSPISANPATLCEAAVLNWCSMAFGEPGISRFSQQFSASAINTVMDSHIAFNKLM